MKLLELADAAAVIIIMAFLIMALTMRTYVLNGHESACVSCLTVAIQYVPITHAWRELGWGEGLGAVRFSYYREKDFTLIFIHLTVK